jgi:transcriptional regulator with XRE-family HTH domain
MTKPYRRMPLVQTIYRWRQRHYLSEKECARILGITPAKLYRIELHHESALPVTMVDLMRKLDREWGEVRLYDSLADQIPPYTGPPRVMRKNTPRPWTQEETERYERERKEAAARSKLNQRRLAKEWEQRKAAEKREAKARDIAETIAYLSAAVVAEPPQSAPTPPFKPKRPLNAKKPRRSRRS